MNNTPTPPTPAPPPPALPGQAAPPATTGYAVKRPLGRVVLFSILSFGLYTFYWFYATRKELNQELGKEDDAALYTAGLLVPILQYFIIYWLWRDLNDLRTRVGLEPFNVVLYVVLTVFVPFAAIVIYIMVLNRLDEYWDVRTGGQAVDAPVTTAEKVIVGIGIAFFLLWIVIIVIAIAVAGN